MTNPKGYFRVGRRKAALGVSGDRTLGQDDGFHQGSREMGNRHADTSL